jgi:hypothetical protein
VNTFAQLDAALAGPFRRTVVAAASDAKDMAQALRRLRDSMRAHAWRAYDTHLRLDRIVRENDSRTRQDGFHVLHDWDGKAGQVNPDIIPVDVLNYVLSLRGDAPADPVVVSILVDYYFVHLLELLSVRVWDEGDADANLDRVDALLAALQGSDGSGQVFADDAETLILIATSHYEPNERGYELLLERVRGLNRRHRARIALGHAASMGSHLRFGFEATYGRDTLAMRDDNVADYPWLCFALATLMREYASDDPVLPREAIAEGLINGLSGDARAFLGEPPPSLSSSAAERTELCDLFQRHRETLLQEFERFRPTPSAYSPVSFFFNFSHNVRKGEVVDALLRGEPWRVSLNDLLTSADRGGATSDVKQALATTLMTYARENPDTIRGRLMPVIVYDPAAGRRAFSVAMSKLAQPLALCD